MQSVEYYIARAALPAEAGNALIWANKSLPEHIRKIMTEGVNAYQKDQYFDYEGYRVQLAVQEKGELWQLLFCFWLAEHLHKLYLEQDRSEQMFDGVLQDFRAKTKECFDYTGQWGCHVAKWYNHWFDLERIALTRLQFEVRKFGSHYQYLTPKHLAINVHIPSIGPLDEQQCLQDYQRAAEFFFIFFDEEIPFMCHSWLLNPDHPDFLPPTSRLLSFQKNYEIFEFSESTEFLWRLFGVAYNGDPHSLTERNSLECAYKNRMISGGRVGEGKGVFFYRKK